ncbi:hypothetical protein D3C74_488380 [compost metagenome]
MLQAEELQHLIQHAKNLIFFFPDMLQCHGMAGGIHIVILQDQVDDRQRGFQIMYPL